MVLQTLGLGPCLRAGLQWAIMQWQTSGSLQLFVEPSHLERLALLLQTMRPGVCTALVQCGAADAVTGLAMQQPTSHL